MKLRAIMVFVMLAALVCLSSCIPISRVINVDVTCEQFAANNHAVINFLINIGDTIKVRLCSNPTTGFQWEYEMSGDNVLKEEAHDFEEPEGDVPGAAGIEVWTFKVIGYGTTEVKMAYSQPWEGGEKEEWTYTMTVTIKQGTGN